LDPAYDLIARGYDYNKVVQRVADLLDMPEAEVLSPAKRRAAVKARSMVCYWAYQHLGIRHYWAYKYLGVRQAELARRYGVSQPAVRAAVQNGRKIVEANGFELL
jgi:hypothetical protein